MAGNPTIEIKARGATSQSGAQFVQLKVNDRLSPWIALADFRGSAGRASERLLESNVTLFDDELKQVKAKVRSLHRFPERTFADRVGWHGAAYCLPSGRTICGTNMAKPVVRFARDSARVETAGSLAGWLKGVAKPLAHHKVPSFLMMLPFAAVLLRHSPLAHNFGFELAGPGGTGKSTLSKCIASAVGPIEGPGNFVQSMNATTNALDERMAEYNDLPMILEEWNLFLMGSARGSASSCADLIFRLSDGTSRMRLRGTKAERARHLWLVSSNDPLPDVLRGLTADAANAVMDRMMTIPIGEDRPLGVFDKTKGVDSTVAELVGPLIEAANANHGVALPRFIKAVAKKLADDEAAFHTHLKARIQKFQTRATKWHPEPSERVAQAFGLVYAAGCMAVEFGCLPKSYRPHAAAKAACLLHLSTRSNVLTPLQRLKAEFKAGRFYDSRVEGAEVTPDIIRDFDGILSRGNDFQELQLTPDQLLRITVDPAGFLKDPEIRQILVHEKNRRKIYRHPITRLTGARCFCFRLMDIDGSADE